MPNLLHTFGSSVRGFDSSRQLALGISLGMLIGILPKDNLLVVGLLVILVLSGANLVTGILSALVTTVMSSAAEPLLHRFGETILGQEFVCVLLAKFMQMPVLPWTRLDNTTVAGGVTVGLILFLPVYIISFYFFEKYRDNLRQLLIESRLVNWVVGYSPTEN